MAKYLLGAVVLIIVLGGGYYLWEKMGAPEALPPVQEEQLPQVSTYASSTLGISLTHPSDFTVDTNYAYDAFGPEKLIHGVSFTVPVSMATGTNLAADSYVAVETLPRARTCTGDIFLLANVRAEEMTDAGVTYALATSSEGAAGNTYEEHVYALPDSKPCIAIRYFIHTTALANYDPGTVREYNRFDLLSAFDAIRRSLVIGSGSPTPSSATSTSF